MRCCPLSNTARKLSGKPLTSGGMTNALPSAARYAALTIGKAIDERKNEQWAAVR